MATLRQLIDTLGDEIVKLPLGEQRSHLVQQQEKLQDELDELVQKNVKTDTPKYQSAIAKLEGANQALVAAHQDVQQVAATISKIAEVIGVLAEIAASAP